MQSIVDFNDKLPRLLPPSRKKWRVALVISNKPDAAGIDRARRAGVPVAIINHKDFDKREFFDKAVDKCLQRHEISHIALAGFMRVLGDEFCRKWAGKCINTHPSLLPAYPGNHAVQQALDAGVEVTGCSIHFVEPSLDLGPVIKQAAVRLLGGDEGLREVTERVKEQEQEWYPRVIDAWVNGVFEYEKSEERGKVKWVKERSGI